VVYDPPRFGNVSATERDKKKCECVPEASGRVRRVVGAGVVEYAAVARFPAVVMAASCAFPRYPRTLLLMALPNKSKIPVGTLLAGKYRITREIGRGGMAAVYEAENVDIGKRVAIKVLAQELTTSAIVVERFLREARAAAAIRSPYICDVYDSGKLEDGRPFLVLELLEGDSLYERMTKIRLIPVDTTLSIITQTCRGLTKAHAASIVHRDLKPENIFLTKDEEGKLLAKILDFGLAKFYAPMGGSPQQARLTREGAVFGTPAYMSPEQVRGQGAVDLRADLWALACIVYECFTGRTVWSTEQGVAMTFAQIASAPLPRPAQYRPDLPESFTSWFDQALDRNIEKRFQTAKEFAESLTMALTPGRGSFAALGPISANEATPAPGTPNPFLAGGSSAFGPADKPAPDGDAFEKTRQFVTGGPGIGIGPEPPSQPGANLGQVPPSPHASTLSFSGPRGPELPAPTTAKPAAAGRLGKVALVVALLGVGGGGVYVGLTQFQDVSKPPQLVVNASASASTTPPPPDPSSARPVASASASAPWMRQIQDGQQAITTGDLKGAAKLFKDAFDKSGGHGLPRTLNDHLAVAIAGASDAKATCRLTGLARPRSYDLGVTQPVRPIASGRPEIVYGAHGAVMTWTDSHEGAEHAYSVALDDALRDKLDPVDVSPEATQALKPELTRAGEELVLSYTDARGNDPGGHARFLDADGRIKGPLMPISSPAARPSTSSPAITRAPDGTSYAVWSDEGAGDSEDLFLRRLSPTLEAQGDAIRLTDLVPAGPSRPRARIPSLAIDSGGIFLAYRVEREPVHSIYAMHLPLGDGLKGLEPPKKSETKTDRNVSAPTLINTDKSKADGPSLACASSACFLAWYTEGTGGASAALLDPTKGQPLWRRKFSHTGTHPAVAVSATGQAQLVWFDGGTVMTASINRDTVGQPSRIARVIGDQPMPSITAGGKPGEWYLAWLDYEAGHLEAYAARVLCK
jgi:serine/threonine-protein kinase